MSFNARWEWIITYCICTSKQNVIQINDNFPQSYMVLCPRER